MTSGTAAIEVSRRASASAGRSRPGNDAIGVSDIGMIGLGVMGRNLLLNMADHGISVAGYDQDRHKTETLLGNADLGGRVRLADTISDFVDLLRTPRAIMILVPSGAAVDGVIQAVTPHLQAGDLIIDGGNSHFRETEHRARILAVQGLHFLGVGISGGEDGARHGASLMPGGPLAAYERVRGIFEACAARIGALPCVSWIGPGSAGHFVKMVHNGIEYGIMELLAEAYDLMKRGLMMDDDAIREVFTSWNGTEIGGLLVEISSRIFAEVDPVTGKRLIDEILDVARQKGTGMWTTTSAMELHVASPTIDAAVALRTISMLENQRERADSVLHRPVRPCAGDPKRLVQDLRHALHVGLIATFAQGMAILGAASKAYGYGLEMETIARIWTGGCIIRCELLRDIRLAYHNRPGLENLLIDPKLSQLLMIHQESLRQVIHQGIDSGIPLPGLMASLAYIDAYRSPWLPANLIQAQRDWFGAHTFERIDAKGSFHEAWSRT